MTERFVSEEGFLKGQGLDSREIKFLLEDGKTVRDESLYELGIAAMSRGLSHRKDFKEVQEGTIGQLARFLGQRGVRSQELSTPEVRKSREIMLELHGVPVFAGECLDGRNSLTLIAGWISGGGTGGSWRADKGKIDTIDGHVDPLSIVNFKVEQAVINNDHHGQIFGAHLGCAAQAAEMQEIEKTPGSNFTAPEDGGLWFNVLEKQDYVNDFKDRYDNKLTAFQYSYDPHHGGVYYVMPSENLNRFMRQHDPNLETGLIEPVLGALVDDGLVLSSNSLLEYFSNNHQWFNDLINDGISQAGNFNWETNYPKTALAFWSSLRELSHNEWFGFISDEVIRVGGNNGLILSDMEIRLRSLFVAEAMMQVAFLTELGDKHWPYSEHSERIIKFSDNAGPAPFKDPAFLDTAPADRVPGNLLLTTSVIDRNRERFYPQDLGLPFFVVNAASVTSNDPSSDHIVSQKAVVAQRVAALRRNPQTKRMLDEGKIVKLNLLKGKDKQILDIFY